jgi:phosphatidylinositol alpha-mannosyltransferase
MLGAPMTAAARLRVAIVAPYDLSAPGGITNQIRAQARALRQLGHTAEIFGSASGALEAGEQSLGRTVTVTLGGTESGLGIDPRAFGAVGRMLRRSFDIVHIHEPLTPVAPWIVLLRSRAPVVGTFHVHRERGHGLYRAWSWALQPLARRIRARIAVSEAARRTVAQHFPGDYEIVPNGIDCERFRIPQPRPPAFARDRRHVVYVGRLEPRKGVEYLVRAMPRVRQRAPDASLMIVGDGSDRGSLAQLAREVGASVQFAGRIRDEELPGYVQAADVVCSPALGGESFGVVLLEAMASGAPVVASRIEGYEALVGATEAARLVSPGDAEALATEIVTLLESAEQRRALAENGAALAREHDWHTLAPRLVAIYRRVIGGSWS